MSETIIIGNDHGAVELKNAIVAHLTGKGFEVKDLGVGEEEAVDYPDKAEELCRELLAGDYKFGILLCGTGIGISISANKIDGIRCALPQDLFAAEMSKLHNNANVIAFGGRIAYKDSVTDMIDKFMETDFEGGRHDRRVDKIMDLEK
ncbi:ribose 5-phosphate isomerase B [Spirochaeta isovalerica]|uniref:Ribose 5-phosphate isomerase B n=1 Tax=Spirochaeta isovalerica TaxID=150 RepID=A0A841RFZ0_9SPIO|nr:ribose 5-phosphate isomerase B [Spirochaeta isovalerica]MBB6481468.1 ribose 5-phosphate isomerase B [Spirochaeta isovalerica]